MKTIAEKLIEAFEKSGIKGERSVINFRKSNTIAKFIKAQEESEKRALESNVRFKGVDYCPDVAQFLKQKHESENRKGLPEMYFKLNYN